MHLFVSVGAEMDSTVLSKQIFIIQFIKLLLQIYNLLQHGAINKWVKRTELEGRSHPAITLRSIQ